MPQGKGTYGTKRGRPPAKKKLSAGQKMIASKAGNPNKIEAADFKKLRRTKK